MERERGREREREREGGGGGRERERKRGVECYLGHSFQREEGMREREGHGF